MIQRGSQGRATGATHINELSSRSHAIFIVIVEQNEKVQETEIPDEEKDGDGDDAAGHSRLRSSHLGQRFKVGKFHLVDLAGSERVSTVLI